MNNSEKDLGSEYSPHVVSFQEEVLGEFGDSPALQTSWTVEQEP